MNTEQYDTVSKLNIFYFARSQQLFVVTKQKFVYFCHPNQIQPHNTHSHKIAFIVWHIKHIYDTTFVLLLRLPFGYGKDVDVYIFVSILRTHSNENASPQKLSNETSVAWIVPQCKRCYFRVPICVTCVLDCAELLSSL